MISRRESDKEGLPPAHHRLSSPYDTDARWAAKGERLFWCGYKLHLTETCDTADGHDDHPGGEPGDGGLERTDARGRPNLITNVATTVATVPDVKMTTPIHQELARRDLLPAEHYVDSGYPCAEVIDQAHRQFGLTLVSPALLDSSRQARAGDGFDKSAFTIDWPTHQLTCPQGNTSTSWSPARQRDSEVIVVKFDTATCRACPVRNQCTSAARGGRQLTLRPQEPHQALAHARAEQTTQTWRANYALRAGAEATIHQAVTTGGMRRARYRSLPKVALQHAFAATAINLVRLHEWWTSPPLQPTRKASHLTRLDHALAA